ncbi:hypothetical protein BCV72DRAFT_228632 [Rhizopus microsporus var. microsporus]|uniref:Nudix hydrolase domain-containing protein n=2 Tax=Rhizopus microsporus TaxID=58291 RepID=A0A2G4T111_RHIZD|nr:uncharacterized protein RHIMIDRAFT_275996 [Rhizopus microsporus ATCC 52813]ORE06189.1 hypothetical protein BCV72DRAFT_228632 [Rhizopus microsporus var. microsporus]PHZ14710.1 hypothetical protein RHIMIDRAFT_275996 [Rhizopus microsporus ATCC 52813]
MIRSSASLIIAAPLPKELLKHNSLGCNYRILMVKRNAKSSFIHAHVYPGGIVDKADSEWPQTEKYSTEKICAIRETFEESGLFVSEPSITIPDSQHWRHRIHKDASQFQSMCEKYKVAPAVDKLIPFANWITPEQEKKRYNTIFFLSILKQYDTKREQDAYLNSIMADGTETLLFDWLKPEEALEKFEKKEIILMPPQWYSLYTMSKCKDYKDLDKVGYGIFRTNQELIPILPKPRPSDLKDYLGYLEFPGEGHRLYFKSGRPMQGYKLQSKL